MGFNSGLKGLNKPQINQRGQQLLNMDMLSDLDAMVVTIKMMKVFKHSSLKSVL